MPDPLLPSPPLLSIVVATHGYCPELEVMIRCWQLQREYRPGPCCRSGRAVPFASAGPLCATPWEMIVCHDGIDPVRRRSFLAQWIDDPRIRYIQVPRDEKPSVGHNTRAAGVNAARGDYVILTNADNYFVPGALHRIADALRAEHAAADLLWWDCVNNLWGWQTSPGRPGHADLAWGRVDLSCVAVRRAIARHVGFPWRNYDGDWDWIDACRQASASQRHIPQVLCVHA